jgi:hypothetical protein
MLTDITVPRSASSKAVAPYSPVIMTLSFGGLGVTE